MLHRSFIVNKMQTKLKILGVTIGEYHQWLDKSLTLSFTQSAFCLKENNSNVDVNSNKTFVPYVLKEIIHEIQAFEEW